MNRKVVASNILIGTAAFLGAILVNLATNSIPTSWQPYLWLAWPLAVAVTGASIWLSIRYADAGDGETDKLTPSSVGGDYIAGQVGAGAENVAIGRDITQTVVKGDVQTEGGDFVARDKITVGTVINNLLGNTLSAQQLARARKILLENVSKFWVEGVLNNSLHNEVLITLGLEEKPGAVDNRPWAMVLQTPQQADRTLPAGTKIIDVFDEQQQRLLILGAPGSGKTTMLLELARDLIRRAQQDEHHPIPVVLNLSSWAARRQPLSDWVVDELNTKYYISPKVARTWVESDALLLLLDGLDEVQLAHRDACVTAINEFRKSHLVSLLVCSRIADYETLEHKLQLQGAVLLQPLLPDQINDYFAQFGPEYRMVQTVLRQDSLLLEFADTPLMLSIMTLAYRNAPAATFAQLLGADTQRSTLFDTYIRQMLQRKSPVQPYSVHQLLHWLRKLAGNMVQRQQTVFLIEQLQPSWLETRSRTWFYRLSIGLIYGLSLGLIAGLSGRLSLGLITGLIVGLIVGLSGGLSGGLFGGLIFGLSGRLDQISPTEHLVFSWRITKRRIVGLIVGLIAVLIVRLISEPMSGMITLIITLIAGTLIITLIAGLIKVEGATSRTIPNQAVWHSVRNMLIGGLIYGLNVGLIGWLFGWLFIGLFIGLFVGLYIYGGAACLQHVVLRCLLRLYNLAPLNYARFLDYCAERILLRKVGGGYIFIHRLLMEHFAAMTEEDIERIAGGVK